MKLGYPQDLEVFCHFFVSLSFFLTKTTYRVIKSIFSFSLTKKISQEDEDFPNLAETVILKDTWAVISRQVLIKRSINGSFSIIQKVVTAYMDNYLFAYLLRNFTF